MIGFYTLFKRELARFLLDALDTIAPPTMSVILYLLIFGVALGPRLGTVAGWPYPQFMGPGLLFMVVALNSFYNPAYSVFQSRWDGNIADFLASPLSSTQIALAVILAGMVRGLLVGALVAVALWALLGLSWVRPLGSALYLGLTSLTFASLGAVAGLWTKGWEGVNALVVFVLEPLVLLGGVFYAPAMVHNVPVLSVLSRWDPLTWMIQGFRAVTLGGEGPLPAGLALSGGLAVASLGAALILFWRGYHLKL